MSLVGTWRNPVLGRRNSKCKCPEAEAHHICLRNYQEASIVESECSRRYRVVCRSDYRAL